MIEHELDDMGYCDCEECWAARDEERGKAEENETWYVEQRCPSCSRDVTPAQSRQACECGFEPWPEEAL